MKKLTKLLTMLLSLALVFTMCIPSAFAASNNANVTASSSKPVNGQLIDNKNEPVYKDAALKNKIGTVYGRDTFKILRIDLKKNIIYIEYPVDTGGKKEGFLKASKVFLALSGNSYKSTGRFNTYWHCDSSKSAGYVDANDVSLLLGKKGDFYQLVYPVKGGFKTAFARTADVNKFLLGKDNGKSSSRGELLAEVAEAEIGYQGTKSDGTGKGDYTKYGKWFGTNGVQWCAIFTSWCSNCAGVSTKVVPKKASTLDMARGSNAYHAWSSDSITSIRRGDVIFFSKTQGSLTTSNGGKSVHHVGIVSAVSGGSITVTEGNTSSDRVAKNRYTVDTKTGAITNWSGHYFCGYISVS